MSLSYYRSLALAAADGLDRLAGEYHAFSLALDGDPNPPTHARNEAWELHRVLVGACRRAGDLALAFDPHFEVSALALGLDICQALDRDAEDALYSDLADGVSCASGSAKALAGQLRYQASVLRADHRSDSHPGRHDKIETHLLMWMARALPAAKRSRFVVEALGNLGDCQHWWQRVDHQICLALGTPRLAWTMWREGRRGRA